VQALVFGDRACYVNLVDAAGQPSTQLARFDLCAQDLVGQPVQLTYAPGSVVAAVCNGDGDCDQRDIVLLITQAMVIEPRPTASAPRLTVADLPDGNYRYWTGTSTQPTVNDSELLAEGGGSISLPKAGGRDRGYLQLCRWRGHLRAGPNHRQYRRRHRRPGDT
jgi:hypothetical protein